jgi:hypothetical protein
MLPLYLASLLLLNLQTVDSILYDKFRDRPGREMVKNRRYIIQDRLTGTILRQDIPFIQATRPGQKLLMAMVFYSKPELENICPRCNVITVAGSSIDVEW